MKQLLAVLIAFSIGAPPIVAQDNTRAQNTNRPITVEVQLVDVYVTVVDQEGGPSTPGLERENFDLFEDGVRREIIYFGQGDIPLRTCHVADTSGSMMPNADKVVQSLTRFARMGGKDDRSCLIAFTEEGVAERVSSFVNTTEIQNKIVGLPGGGKTPLMDGLYLALLEIEEDVKWEKEQIDELQRTISNGRESDKAIRAIKKKNAVIVISDGGENHSSYSENDVLHLAQELEVQIYAIGVYDRARSDLSREEERGPTLLKEIAEKTGGRVFSVEKTDDLTRIMAAVSSSLKTQYHIQFKPTGAKEKPKQEGSCPDYREITVKVKPPKGMPALKVYARRGYCPPA